MPELPEVETTVRGLARYLEGERITRVAVNRPDLRRPFPPDLVQVLTGARVTQLSRRAKHGLIHTDRGRILVFHLGMSGRWRVDPEVPDKHDHLVIETQAHSFALNDPRRFGSVDLVAETELAAYPPFAALGPEPLGDAFTADWLHKAMRRRKQAIKLLLLDQRVVGGLGNIYVCEALFRAGIAPRKAGGRVTGPQLKRLIPAIRQVLEQAICAGGSSLRDFAGPDGTLGYFPASFAVYGREGQACLGCKDGIVRRIAQGGRSSWYCPGCQR